VATRGPVNSIPATASCSRQQGARNACHSPRRRPAGQHIDLRVAASRLAGSRQVAGPQARHSDLETGRWWGTSAPRCSRPKARQPRLMSGHRGIPGLQPWETGDRGTGGPGCQNTEVAATVPRAGALAQLTSSRTLQPFQASPEMPSRLSTAIHSRHAMKTVAHERRSVNALPPPNPLLESGPTEAGHPCAAQGSRRLHCPARRKDALPRRSAQLAR
jgi:hypothetical protein